MNLTEAFALFDAHPKIYSWSEANPLCPFCRALYASVTEVRPEITCQICQGQAALADFFSQLMSAELDRATDEKDLAALDRIADTLIGGYWQMEARIRARKIRRIFEADMFPNFANRGNVIPLEAKDGE